MKLSKAYDQYGAQMGRRSNTSEATAPVKMHLQRVSLDSGGYDSGGAYWGTGAPLYRAWSDDGGTEEMQEVFLRAYDRGTARQRVLKRFPNARFYK